MPTQGLVSTLKREPSVIFKAKSNPSVYVLATQILLLTLQHSYDWPESIGKVCKNFDSLNFCGKKLTGTGRNFTDFVCVC